MKKFKLLEKAMRDYPKGTVARFKSAPHVDHVSDGVFKIFKQLDDDNLNWEISVLCGGGNCVYSNGEWAVPVAHSLLSGRVAIQVNNEREFNLLMEHYEAKGWKWINGEPPLPISNSTKRILDIYNYKTTVMYQDNFQYNIAKPEEWKIIPFSDFATEVGVTVPKFIMKSEDGVYLYEGNEYHRVSLIDDTWQINASDPLQPVHSVVSHHHTNKAFSTKEAAEAWIAEQNKPTVIRLDFDGGEAIITKDKIRVHLDAENGKGYYMEATEIEPIYAAYKSLQTKQN